MNRSVPDWLIASGLLNIPSHVVPCNVQGTCKTHRSDIRSGVVGGKEGL